MDNSALFTFLLIVAGIVGLFVLVTVVKTMYTVRTYTAGVVERFGKFNRVARPGLQFLMPWCETVRFIDLQVRQAVVNVETKTKDNVFVTIPVSVQYPGRRGESFRRLLQTQQSAEPRSRATSSTPSSATCPRSPSTKPSSRCSRSPAPSKRISTK